MAADFADPIWVRPGSVAWCVPAASGRHPPLAVEDTLQVAVLLPPTTSSAGLVCSCHHIRSATTSVVEVVPSRVATEPATLEPVASVFSVSRPRIGSQGDGDGGVKTVVAHAGGRRC